MADRERAENFEYSGRKARQGEIILRTPAQRAIFLVGLVGCVLLGLILLFAA